MARLETATDVTVPPDGAAVRLAVRRLTLTDFRCYRRQRLETEAGPVVLTGPNGAGKTNILEALSFLVPGRGLRRARLADVARRPDNGVAAIGTWAVAAQVEGMGGAIDIGTGREVQEAVGAYRRAEFGRSLFTPAALEHSALP